MVDMITFTKAFTKGDSFTLSYVAFGSYSPLTHDLKISLRGAGSKADFSSDPTITDSWSVYIDPLQSSELVEGLVKWSAVMSLKPGAQQTASARVTVSSGTTQVLADLSEVGADFDGRSLAQKAFDDCEKALSSFSQSGGKVKKYTIGTRQMEFESMSDIIQLLGYWRLRVMGEKSAIASMQAGGNAIGAFGGPRDLKVRFTR